MTQLIGQGQSSAHEYTFIHGDESPSQFRAEVIAYASERGLDYRYLQAFLDYQIAYSGRIYKDMSFLVRRKGQTVGFAFVPLESDGKLLSVSVGGGYVPAPATDDAQAEKAAFSHLHKISVEYGVERVALHACLTNHGWEYNRLRIHGFVDMSSLDATVDLTLDETTIWRYLRKSYKSLINKFNDRNGCEILVIDSARPDFQLHEEYRYLHAKCAGRATRDKVTFDLQYKMLLDGCATLMVLRHEQRTLGSAYFLHHGNVVDYFSMADDPDLRHLEIPISHLLLWRAIRYFKSREYRLMRLSPPAGFSHVEGFGDYSDEKPLAIAHFKHGMATNIVTSYRGMRFYTLDAFDRELARFREASAPGLLR